jgi:hypothetical protein
MQLVEPALGHDAPELFHSLAVCALFSDRR